MLSSTEPKAGLRVIEADINFAGQVTNKPHAERERLSKPGQENNANGMTYERRQVSIEDASSAPLELDLDREGFMFMRHPSKVADFKDADEVRAVYHDEVREFLKSLVGADIVEFRDEIGVVRSSEAAADERGTALIAHLDFTDRGAHYAVEQEFPDRRKDVRRWAFIKIWRSLSPAAPVDVPFALLDARTLKAEDVVPVDTEYSHLAGVTESAALRYSPDHRWIYASDMKRDDIVVFKTYDSDPTRSAMAAHTAFVDPTAPADATRRSSFELRAYVAWI